MSFASHHYESLTEGAGFVVLDDWSAIEVSGTEGAKFLHNLCTNHIVALAPGQGCEAFFTDVKAHILAHVLVTCRESSFVLTRSAANAADLLAHLDRYLIREDVQLHDRAGEWRYLLVSGAEALGKLVPAALPVQLALPLAHARVEVDGARCALIRFPAEAPAWLLQCPLDAASRVAERLVSAGIDRCRREAWETLRIEMGFPLDRVDVTAQNLPQEIGRDERAVHFQKGCYLGQETVARIDALGHVNQTLVMVKFAGERVPARDTQLFAVEKGVGRITSACDSPRFGRPLALAFVRRGHNAPGAKLQSEFGEAEVVELGR